VIPLLGARTPAQLQGNLGCLDFELDATAGARLDALSAIELGYPHDYLRRTGALAHPGIDTSPDKLP
jgi:diketogulonate reductase-like aldo/keto reductase